MFMYMYMLWAQFCVPVYTHLKATFILVHHRTCSRTLIGTFGTKGTIGTNMETLVLGDRNRRQPGYLLLEKWIGRMQLIHITEHFAAVRHNKLNAYIATRVEFKSLTFFQDNLLMFWKIYWNIVIQYYIHFRWATVIQQLSVTKYSPC